MPVKEGRGVVAGAELAPLLPEQAGDPVAFGPSERVDELDPAANLYPCLRLGGCTAHLTLAGSRVAKGVIDVDVAPLHRVDDDVTTVCAVIGRREPKHDRLEDACLVQPLTAFVEAGSGDDLPGDVTTASSRTR